jgi:hypothetical protein
MRTYTHHLHRIASDIDSYGVAANEAAIANVVDDAQAAGVCPVLLTVLSDPTEPEVARARAFGMVATALAAGGTQPAEHDVTTPPPVLVAMAS